MIIMCIVFFIMGILIGINVTHDWKSKDRQKLFEKIDDEVRQELYIKTNQVVSLQEDVSFLRKRLKFLEDKNG